MKHILYLLMLMPLVCAAQGNQPLTLERAYQLARDHYPVTRQKQLLQQTAGINIDNLQKGFLPQVNLSGQASYQSDVTSISIPVPGISIVPPSKDQYKLIADISQLLYDGGAIKTQENVQRLNEATEQQKLEVELYTLKGRINQLFLSVLYLDEQLKQSNIVKSDLLNGISKTEALVNNGVAFRSNLDLLKAELLSNDQKTIEIRAARKGYINVLALFIDQPLTEDTKLEMPIAITAVTAVNIARPELKLFSLQDKLLTGQFKLIDSRNRPRANLFVQGGYGKPGLNMLKNDLSFFYIAGLRVNWSLGGLYTEKKEKELININKRIIGIQQETFLLNTNAALKQQESDIAKFEELIAKDNEIIGLRVNVKEAAKAQLSNGVITANDYLREVNAEDRARQSLIAHQVQLLQAKINYQTISGQQ